MKKPKTEWQVAVKAEMDKHGLTCKDLAEAVGSKAGYVRQLMCGSYHWVGDDSSVKERITKYLEIE